MPNAPYTDPPVSPQVKNDADAIYFGWMGLAQDATFQANMSLIIKNGHVAALTDPAVIAAHTLAIKNALIDPAVIAASTLAIKTAINDPVTLANWEAVIENGVEDAIANLVAAQILPSRADWRKAVALLALASVAVRKSKFLEDSDPVTVAELKARVIQLDIDVL